ncbi:MAG TPA: peptidoglycan DD-metalloendopeptidase family protein [Gaiellaceae bacterium]
MTASLHLRAALAVALTSLVLVSPAQAAGRAAVAALQVALRHRHVYRGPVDGLIGPRTRKALRRFQRRHGLVPDGIAGPRTRRAFGRFARHLLGTRELAPGLSGWDVAELQFALAWHGFPSGTIDGAFGLQTESALLRFQRWAGLPDLGIAGRSTLRALRSPLPRCPISLAWPLQAPVGSPFGSRGTGFHPGLDLPAPSGTPVAAAASGRVVFAAFDPGGYGNLVELKHRHGVLTMYAHLSAITVAVGSRIRVGARVGRVGATGEATGPHLHFEVRVRGAAVNPLPALQ